MLASRRPSTLPGILMQAAQVTKLLESFCSSEIDGYGHRVSCSAPPPARSVAGGRSFPAAPIQITVTEVCKTGVAPR